MPNSTYTSKEICAHFFELVEEETTAPDAEEGIVVIDPEPSASCAKKFRCRMCLSVRIQDTSKGYTNLMSHVKGIHSAVVVKMQCTQ
jgi:hypothetical protein